MSQLMQELFGGVTYFATADGVRTLIMFLISGLLIYLAIAKDYEPALLLPIGFGAILANPQHLNFVTGSTFIQPLVYFSRALSLKLE